MPSPPASTTYAFTPQSVVFFCVFVIIRGTLTLMLKLAGTEIPPCTLSFARSMIAFIILTCVAFVLSRTRKFRTLPNELKVFLEWKFHAKVFMMGLLQSVVAIVLFTYILAELDSAVAGVMISTQPMFVLIYTCIVKKDERKKVNWRTVLGLVIGFLGVLALFSVAFDQFFSPSTGRRRNMTPYYEYLAVVAVWSTSSVFWAVQNADKRITAIPGALGQNLYGWVISLPLMLGVDYPMTHFRFLYSVTYKGIIGVVWMGLSGAGSALCLMYLLTSIGPVKTSAVQYFVPVISIIESIIVFHSWHDETFLYKGSQVLGAVLVVIGVLVMNLKPKNTKPKPETQITGSIQVQDTPTLYGDNDSDSVQETSPLLAPPKEMEYK